MPFKGISYLGISQSFCAIFGRGYYEAHFCEIIQFGPVVQEEITFKRFLISSSGSPLIGWNRNIYANLKEGIMRNIHGKLYEIWTSGSGDVV